MLLALLLALSGGAWGAEVTEFSALLSTAETDGQRYVALRSFRLDGVPSFLLVHPQTLASRVSPAAAVRLKGQPDSSLKQTPYLRALARHTAPPHPLQNDGAIHGGAGADGMFLTVDLCPSRRPFEAHFFESLPRSAAAGGPVPVAVAISGQWLATHIDDFRWLLGQVAAGRLAITWVNHSLTHPYDASQPLQRTFLLTPGIDLRHEILETERLLLANGAVPSPFFRFPGLVSDQGAMELLSRLGLIPVGSDAWLAKGENPGRGSIVLVHGNGNEPAGIARFNRLVAERGPLPLIPLAEAFLP
jgi:hypothetical protein